MGNFKEAIKKSNDDINADLALAKEVTKDFIEILEQSVNSGILRLIALCLSQSNGPLDRYVCAYIKLSIFQKKSSKCYAYNFEFEGLVSKYYGSVVQNLNIYLYYGTSKF